MTDYVITGGRSSSYPSDIYGSVVVGTRHTCCLKSDLVNPSANVLAIPNLSLTVLSASPISVADTFFGMSIMNRSNNSVTGVTFKTTRSHDLANGKGRWQKIQPTSSRVLSTWDFADLDAWVDTHYAAGRDLIFTLFATPLWAVSVQDQTEQGIYGPANLGVQAEPEDMANWDFYCTTIATRYLGKIKYYEIWNEPNMNNDGTGPTATGTSTKRFFFSGTFAKLAEMTRRANQAIKAVDPTAKIICAPVQGWEASGTDNSGSYFTGMMAASSGDAGNTPMKDWVDIVGVHLYLPSVNKTQDLAGVIDRVNAAKTTAGVSALETWDTESAPIGGDAATLKDPEIKKIIGRSMITMAAKGIARTVYYQYDHATMGIKDRGALSFREEMVALLRSGTVLGASKLGDGRVAYSTSAGVYVL